MLFVDILRGLFSALDLIQFVQGFHMQFLYFFVLFSTTEF